MSDDEFACGENWDHDLEFEYDDDGSWVANCRECGVLVCACVFFV